jgi:hypothetical protein
VSKPLDPEFDPAAKITGSFTDAIDHEKFCGPVNIKDDKSGKVWSKAN